MRCVSENHHSPLPPNTLTQHLYIFSSGGDIEVKWWGKFQGQVVGISRSTGGGTPRPSGGDIEVKWSSSGDIEVKWWGYQGQGEGLRGQGQKKVVGGEDSGQEREGMPKSPKARKESSKREREEGRMSEEGLNPFRKSSRTERSPSRGEERNQSKEIEEKIETVLREIKEDMAGIVEESRARRKELAAAREKEGEKEREDMLKSSEVKKESSKREREEGRTSKEGKNPLRNSSRTRRSPNRSQEENQSKEMDKEMKTTMIREMREEIKTLRKELAAVREENGELRKELATVRREMRGREEKGQLEKADWMKRMEMIEEKMEQREKKERKNNVIITGIGAISGNVERGVEEWLEREIGVKVNVKEAFKINKDKMMLAKIENWEQKKNIMLNDDLTKEERETQKKLRELAREERDRGKRVKIGYRKIQINGDWFRWDKRQEKLKKIC
ncbi:hypothetical protein GEV33_005562 [Tenebrio molitor]|uniref:Uncharacterized protein n=1 Tax=Tenebrio molitor TaxID=7067 RepID=A0A8J6HM87_TENMO|nr:hypothetical protein GEV33_005562 [Tenebrio molitor]